MVGVADQFIDVSQQISFDNFSSSTIVSNTGTYRMSPLHELIWFGNKEEIENFIKQKKESGDMGDVLRTYDRDGRSILMYAIIKKDIPTIKLLMKCKPPVNYTTEDGYSALFYAIYYNVKEAVELLIKKKIKVNVKSKGKHPITPLLLACAKGFVPIVCSLLQAGAEVNEIYETEGERFNSLMLTLHSSEISARPLREAICELLVEKNVNSVQPRSDGCTPMMCAISENMTDFIKLILEKNRSKLDKVAEDKCTTALWVAMQRRNEQVVKLLIDNECSIETGKSRSSPLHAATLYNFEFGVKILLDKGIPIMWMDQPGFTPVHYAACFPDTKCLELILEKGINIEVPAKRSGFTPLVIAALKGNIPGMKMLLEHNAKLEVYDKKDGITPLIATIINNHVEAFKFLLEQGADVMGRRSGCGMTPLMNAIGLNREEIRDIISEYSKKNGKMGEMRKQGGGHRSKGWKKRIFVLYGTYFYYYKSDKQISPQGIVILDSAKVLDSPKGKLNFQIETPARTYQIKADTEEMRNDWFNAISEAIESFKPDQKPSQAFSIEGKIPEIPELPTTKPSSSRIGSSSSHTKSSSRIKSSSNINSK